MTAEGSTAPQPFKMMGVVSEDVPIPPLQIEAKKMLPHASAITNHKITYENSNLTIEQETSHRSWLQWFRDGAFWPSKKHCHEATWTSSTQGYLLKGYSTLDKNLTSSKWRAGNAYSWIIELKGTPGRRLVFHCFINRVAWLTEIDKRACCGAEHKTNYPTAQSTPNQSWLVLNATS